LQITLPIGYNKIEIFRGLSTANHFAAIVSGFSLIVPFAKAATASIPSLWATEYLQNKMKSKFLICKSFIFTREIAAKEIIFSREDEL
jgi:hypothetical protein